MKKILFLILITGVLGAQMLDAQSIRRSTLCSVAQKATPSGNVKISSTFGQNCVNCTVDFNGFNYLRQGFQQPPESPDDNPCGYDSDFTFEPVPTDCGTYFNFEYTGLAPADSATFLWEFGNFGAPATSNERNPHDVAFGMVGDHEITLTVFGPDSCSEKVIRHITVDSIALGAQVSTTPETCFGAKDGTITVDVFGGNEPTSVTWDIPGTEGSQVAHIGGGTYTYTITDGDGCVFQNQVTVVGATEPLSIATVLKTPESCAPAADGRILVSVSGGVSPYDLNWSNGATGPDLPQLAAGTYTVTVTDAAGCTQTAGYDLFELCKDGSKIVYDVLTPNDDGQNDVWYIEGIENYPNNTVEVYNRWGNLVWRASGYLNTWRGTNTKGEKLPAGGYYYILRLNESADEQTTIGGSLTIIR
ncbi:MAG: hypothetical protein D6714_02145 [Bacteroidetes bacterium]|nr:MAG: hypothetical protein D6714_02145 [Bacteroidota bacterium]